MLENVLQKLTEQGWSISKLNSAWINALDIKTSSGFMFTYMLDPSQKPYPPIQVMSNDIDNWEIIVLCPEGFNSLYLKNFSTDGFQYYFWDIQTGNIFPFPSATIKSVTKVKNILEGKKIELDIHKPEHPRKFIPAATYFLLCTIFIVYTVMTFSGGSTNVSVLVEFGAKVNLLIDHGQIWRLLTSIFIHIGILHLLFNSYALWILGPYVENFFGWVKFLIIFLVSGVGGSLSSYIFSTALSAGASGAIFGLLGAMLIYSIKQPELWKSGLGKNIIIIIVLNLAFGFFQPGIDNYAHMGGLFTGLILSWILLASKNLQKT